MGKTKKSSKEILETTTKIAGTVATVGTATINILGDNKK